MGGFGETEGDVAGDGGGVGGGVDGIEAVEVVRGGDGGEGCSEEGAGEGGGGSLKVCEEDFHILQGGDVALSSLLYHCKGRFCILN